MKPKSILTLALLLFWQLAQAQNLIPNPSFEDYSSLPTDLNQAAKCMEWFNGGGTPDYYHKNGAGDARQPNLNIRNATPKSGDAFMGIASLAGPNNVGYREYVYTKLKSPMKIGDYYYISFFVSVGKRPNPHTCKLGILFTVDQPGSQSSEPKINPDVIEINQELWDSAWQKVTITYKAKKACNYMQIGNFWSNEDAGFVLKDLEYKGEYRAYHMLDDFSVIRGAFSLKEDTLCLGDSVELCQSFAAKASWFEIGASNNFIKFDDCLTVKPTETTTYLASLGADSAFYTVYVFNKPTLILPDTGVITCKNTAFEYEVEGDYSSYFWSNGNKSSSFKTSQTGKYKLTVSNENCSVTDSIEIINSKLHFDLGPDTLLCEFEAFSLKVDERKADAVWQDGSKGFAFEVSEIGNYWLTLSDGENSCTDSFEVISDCECILYLPNAFSPNGDEHNEAWTHSSTCGFDFYKLQIFNRWGQRVFETNDPDLKWELDKTQKDIELGVYVYTLQYRFKGRPKTYYERGNITAF